MNTLKNATVLAVDDEPLNLIILENFMEHRCKQLLLETDIEAALLLACQKQPDVILLDILMDNMDGYQVCSRLKSKVETQGIPVIFLSSLVRAADKVKGFEVGGVDYISKPFEVEEVVARIENCLKLHGQINQKRQITTEEKEAKIRFYQLTSREVEILHLYVLGMQRNEIAQRLFLSDNTVKSYLQRLQTKLDINSRAQAVEKACEIGLINF